MRSLAASDGYTGGISRLLCILAHLAALTVAATAQGPAAQGSAQPGPPTSLADGHRAYYSGRYEEAAAIALTFQGQASTALESHELRSSALHFLLKRLVTGGADRRAALAACARCPAVLADLNAEIADGRAVARGRLKADERDDEARFYLGKIDLTHVWLHLETLGRRTGWSEYWEARRSLDAVLERQPGHLRARVARAWIDYIVDTRVPRGFRWLLGGGDRRGALAAAEQAAATVAGDEFAIVEARFALWEMLTREGRLAEAATVAKGLAQVFPENRELARAAGGA